MAPWNRRRFLAASAAAGASVLASQRLALADTKAKAPYRVLYSNDTTNTLTCVSPWHKAREPFRPEMLEATVDEVAGMGVDAHLLQPGLCWVPLWPSKVYPIDEHCRWLKQNYGVNPDPFARYILEGGDLVKVFIDRCRKTGQAPFLSIRLNDSHHKEWADAKPGDKVGSAASQGLSRFYCEHPEYRIGTDLKSWTLRALNWAIPAVRDHKFAFIRELCENYEIDGLELDFLRYFSLFPLEKTTSRQRVEIMTAFVKDVRSLLDRTARSGRRRWLCARVPCFLDSLDPLGIDLPAMVDSGLDMVNVSTNYFTMQQTDFAAIRKLVPDASVYDEMCHSTWNGRRLYAVGYDSYPFRRTTPEQFYTTAHLAYARGADGMSAFNFVYYREHGGPGRGPFNEPPFEVFKHLGDREWLARQPQHYFLASGWRSPYTKGTIIPRKLAAKQTAKFALDLAPPAGGWQRGGRFRVQAEIPPGDGTWQVRFNGQILTPSDDISEPYPNPYSPLLGKSDDLWAWQLPASLLRDGINQVEVTRQTGATAIVAYLDLGVS